MPFACIFTKISFLHFEIALMVTSRYAKLWISPKLYLFPLMLMAVLYLQKHFESTSPILPLSSGMCLLDAFEE